MKAETGIDKINGVKISPATVNIKSLFHMNDESKKCPHIHRMIKPIIKITKRIMLNLKPMYFVMSNALFPVVFMLTVL